MKIQYENLIPNNNIKNKIISKCKANLGQLDYDDFTFTIDTQKQNSDFICTVFVRHSSKTILNITSKGKGQDIEDAIQIALTQLESKVRRHKEKIKKHLQNAEGLINTRNKVNKIALSTEILNIEDFVDDFLELSYTGLKTNPKEVKNYWGTSNLEALAMTIEEAYMKMDLENLSLLVFISKDNGLISILHKKPNGQIVAIRDLIVNPQEQNLKEQNRSMKDMLAKLESLQKPLATKAVKTAVAKTTPTKKQKITLTKTQVKAKTKQSVSQKKTSAPIKSIVKSSTTKQASAASKLQPVVSKLKQSDKLAKPAKLEIKNTSVNKKISAKKEVVKKNTQTTKKSNAVAAAKQKITKKNTDAKLHQKLPNLSNVKKAKNLVANNKQKAQVSRPQLKLIINNSKKQEEVKAKQVNKVLQKTPAKQLLKAGVSTKKNQIIKRNA